MILCKAWASLFWILILCLHMIGRWCVVVQWYCVLAFSKVYCTMCGVLHHVWCIAPCVVYCTMCGVFYHVWCIAQCVVYCTMCGVLHNVWCIAPCHFVIMIFILFFYAGQCSLWLFHEQITIHLCSPKIYEYFIL